MRVYRRLVSNVLFLLAVLAVAISCVAQPLEASLQAGDFELGFGVGGTRFDDSFGGEDADYRTELRGGYFLNDVVELELQAARSVGVLDLSLDTALLNAVFNLRPAGSGIVVPYVLVGAGGARIENLSIFSEEDEEETGLAYQAAIGSRFFFGQDARMAFRVELSTTFEDTLDETNRHTSLTGGLLWRIGR